jgi:hypothetical protein
MDFTLMPRGFLRCRELLPAQKSGGRYKTRFRSQVL